MKAQEARLGVVILTLRVHNHHTIIATELQMADRLDKLQFDKLKKRPKNSTLTCIPQLKKHMFQNKTTSLCSTYVCHKRVITVITSPKQHGTSMKAASHHAV